MFIQGWGQEIQVEERDVFSVSDMKDGNRKTSYTKFSTLLLGYLYQRCKYQNWLRGDLPLRHCSDAHSHISAVSLWHPPCCSYLPPFNRFSSGLGPFLFSPELKSRADRLYILSTSFADTKPARVLNYSLARPLVFDSSRIFGGQLRRGWGGEELFKLSLDRWGRGREEVWESYSATRDRGGESRQWAGIKATWLSNESTRTNARVTAGLNGPAAQVTRPLPLLEDHGTYQQSVTSFRR